VAIHEIIETAGELYMVMELCRKGTLFDLLDKSALCRTPKLSRFLSSLSDIDYLHFLDIQHHDLKCENILAVSNDCVKTVDFGFARRC
jgi:serine/threonine protein kinase